MSRNALTLGIICLLALMLVPTALAAPAGQSVDTDGDGVPDVAEIARGTDPNDPTDGNLGDDDAGDDDDDTGTAAPGAGASGCTHPAALKIAESPAISCEEVMAQFETGIGFGRIMMAVRLGDLLDGWTWQDLLNRHLADEGWGSVLVAARLAGETGLSSGELLAYREAGGNWGDIHQAARLAQQGTTSIAELLAERAGGKNWGQIRKELGLAGPPCQEPPCSDPQGGAAGGPGAGHGGGPPPHAGPPGQ